MNESHRRRYAILAHGQFGSRSGKTAHGVIAYSDEPTVAVIDRSQSGQAVRDVLPALACDAPIVSSLADALPYDPTALLIGIAPPGGDVPPEWRAEIVAALEAGLDVVNGLHVPFGQDQGFLGAASRGGARIWDVRESPPEIPIFSGAAWDIPAQVLLTVGSDCAVGKMTVALELTRAARVTQRNAGFVPTGQTGIMIAGWGIAIDRVIADFAPGAVEQLVVQGARNHDLLIVEGQGSINHPAYGPVTLALLYGSAPDALLLVHQLPQTEIEGFGTPILHYRELIAAYESLCASVKPARVIGIALNTSAVDDVTARRAIADASAQTGLPCDDVVRYGPEALWSSLAPQLASGKTKALRPFRG
jgi:uncharacterized NAD-dependent epimerase/dehydratase family protein